MHNVSNIGFTKFHIEKHVIIATKNIDDYDSLIIYIVQKGDTLWKIAKRFRSTVEDISRVNGIEDQNQIQVGQKLYIPKFKTVRKGNTDAISA